MGVDDVIDMGQRAMILTLVIASPMLLSGMIVGLVISIFQSVTQVQEITLTFIPKIMAVMGFFILFLPWMTDMMIVYVRELYASIYLLSP